MLQKYSLLFSLLLISGLSSAHAINLQKSYDENLLNRLRGKFIISGASHFYYPDLKYGGYLIPKEHIDDNLCKNKQSGTFYFVDHEGGNVKRISSNTPSAQKSISLKRGEYENLWNEDMKKMKTYCLDAILGPSVDIGMGSGRSYSTNLEYNFKAIKPLLEVSKNNKVLSVVKHFPGLLLHCDKIPSSKEQSICSEDLKYLDNLWGRNLKDTPPESLMVSHYYYKTIKYHPALANQEILEYLRNTKKYKGVVVTDSLWELSAELSLEEIMNLYKYTDLILLMDYKKIEKMIRYLHDEIKKDPSLEVYLVESNKRVMNWRK